MKLIFNILFAFAVDIFRAATLNIFYGWFFLSKFSSLPKLGIIEFFGLIFFVSLFQPPSRDEIDKKSEHYKKFPNNECKDYCFNAGYILGVLLIGYIIHFYI